MEVEVEVERGIEATWGATDDVSARPGPGAGYTASKHPILFPSQTVQY